MINYPATSSVAAQSVRPLLTRIARVFTAASAAGKTAIAAQFIYATTHPLSCLNVMDYPPATDPSAQAIRKDLINIMRMLHMATPGNRLAIAAQMKAAILAVGGAPIAIAGAGGAAVLPAIDAAGKYQLDTAQVGAPITGAAYVDWYVNDRPAPGAGKDILSIAPSPIPQEVRAVSADLLGAVREVTWAIPPTVEYTVLTPAIGVPPFSTEVGYRVGLFGAVAPTVVHGATLKTITTLDASAPGVVVEFNSATKVEESEFNIYVNDILVHMTVSTTYPGGGVFESVNAEARDIVRNSVGVPVTVAFPDTLHVRPTTVVTYPADILKSLTKAQLVQLATGEKTLEELTAQE